jgi:hypothetical protein
MVPRLTPKAAVRSCGESGIYWWGAERPGWNTGRDKPPFVHVIGV